MIPALQGFEIILNTTHRLFLKALVDMDPEQAKLSLHGENPPLWIAAHTVTVRASYLKGLGGAIDVPWGGLFPRGGEVGDTGAWPSLAEVIAKWEEVHPALMARHEALTAEDVNQTSTMIGIGGTLLGALSLMVLHETYHVGQLGLLRPRRGLDRLVG